MTWVGMAWINWNITIFNPFYNYGFHQPHNMFFCYSERSHNLIFTCRQGCHQGPCHLMQDPSASPLAHWIFAHVQCTSEARHPMSGQLASELRMCKSLRMYSSECCSGNMGRCLSFPRSTLSELSPAHILSMLSLFCSKAGLAAPLWGRTNWAQHACSDFRACLLGW